MRSVREAEAQGAHTSGNAEFDEVVRVTAAILLDWVQSVTPTAPGTVLSYALGLLALSTHPDDPHNRIDHACAVAKANCDSIRGLQ